MDLRLRLNYVVAFFGLPTLFGALLARSWLVALAALVTTSWLLVLEAKRDPATVAKFLCLVMLFYLGITALVAGHPGSGDSGLPMSPSAWGMVIGGLAVFASIAAGSGWIWYRIVSRPDSVPDVLAGRFAADSLFEEGGVLWSGTQSAQDLADHAQLDLYFQNCTDGERHITVTLQDSAGLLRTQGHIDVPTPVEVALDGGEVVKLSVPVRAGSKPANDAQLFVSVVVRGTAGKRIRKVRGRLTRKRVGRSTQLLALAGGMALWGGGVAFRFRVPERSVSNSERPRAVPTRERLWPQSPLAGTRPAPAPLTHSLGKQLDSVPPARAQSNSIQPGSAGAVLAPGSNITYRRANGTVARGRIASVRPGQCLCELETGQRVWLQASDVVAD